MPEFAIEQSQEKPNIVGVVSDFEDENGQHPELKIDTTVPGWVYWENN